MGTRNVEIKGFSKSRGFRKFEGMRQNWVDVQKSAEAQNEVWAKLLSLNFFLHYPFFGYFVKLRFFRLSGKIIFH